MQPRNAAAIVAARQAGKLKAGDPIVVSFVGSTELDAPHVFVDSGKRYDWRFAEGLHATIVLAKGTKATPVFEGLFAGTMLYPSVVDLERQVVASLVSKSDGGFKLWPRGRDSEAWRALFG